MAKWEPTLNINTEWFNGKTEITIEVTNVKEFTSRHIAMCYVLCLGYKIKPMECFYALVNQVGFATELMIVGDNYNTFGRCKIIFQNKK